MFLLLSNALSATNYTNDNSTKIGDPIKIIRSNHRLMLFCNNKITFELSSDKLNESARYELGLIASRLIQNPNLKIEIGVFNDTRSNVDYSKAITKKRANSKEIAQKLGQLTQQLITSPYYNTLLDKYQLNYKK